MTTLAPITAIVYQATNRLNGHRYIGFTTQGLEKRVKQHRYYARTGKRYYFQQAIAKYGAENFTFEVMGDFGGDAELARVYEREAIEKYAPEYNLMLGGDAHTPSLETRAKIAAAHKGKKWPNRAPISEETKRKISLSLKGREKPWLRGKPLDEETKRKIGAAHKGHTNYNTKPVTEETRQKLSRASKGRKPWNTGVMFSDEKRKEMGARRKAEHARATPERKAVQQRLGKKLSDVLRKPVMCVTDGLVYESAAAAARFYGHSKSAVANVANKRFPSVGGRVFRYIGAGNDDVS